MARRFVFAYFLKDRPQRINEIALYRAAYWRDLEDAGCFGVQFSDRSGGLISFQASSLDEATEVVRQDPYAVHAVLDEWWIKEWTAAPPRPPCRRGICECPFGRRDEATPEATG